MATAGHAILGGSVRPRLTTLAAAAIAVVAIAVVVTRFIPPGPGGQSGPLPTVPASYLGVYEKGPPATYQPVTTFAESIAKQPNLVGYYSGWGEPFKTSFAETIHQHGAVTILQMDPSWASVSSIAAGKYDAYLRSFARSVRAFGQPVVIGFGHEMNGYWYSWAYRHAAPSEFVAAWRHIVTLFQRQGVTNVTWLWTLQADETGTGPIVSWWPGAPYVSWVGIDGYYYRRTDTFFSIFGETIAQVRMLTTKPVLVSETAVEPEKPARRSRSPTCSLVYVSTTCSGWCGSTSPSTTAFTTRTGASRTARRPRPLSNAGHRP